VFSKHLCQDRSGATAEIQPIRAGLQAFEHRIEQTRQKSAISRMLRGVFMLIIDPLLGFRLEQIF
jgi:hypothetical protein